MLIFINYSFPVNVVDGDQQGNFIYIDIIRVYLIYTYNLKINEFTHFRYPLKNHRRAKIGTDIKLLKTV